MTPPLPRGRAPAACAAALEPARRTAAELGPEIDATPAFAIHGKWKVRNRPARLLAQMREVIDRATADLYLYEARVPRYSARTEGGTCVPSPT